MSENIIYNYVCRLCGHEGYTVTYPTTCSDCRVENDYLDTEEIELEKV
jgi:ribosomal protein L37E